MVLEIEDDDDDKPQSSQKRPSQPQGQDSVKIPKMITPTPLLGMSGQSPRHPWQDPAQPAEEHDHTKVGQSSDCQAKVTRLPVKSFNSPEREIGFLFSLVNFIRFQ